MTTTTITATGPPGPVIAHGGGVQTTALMCMAGAGEIAYRTLLFCNVGGDSEDPGTIAYMREVAAPYCQAKGLALYELHRDRRDGGRETLYTRLLRPGSRSIPIPARMPDTGAPGTRSCTADFKIKIIGRWLKAHGAFAGRAATARRPAVPPRRATVAVGISVDEIHRLNARISQPYECLAYPLVGVIDGTADGSGRKMTRSDCEARILAEPLPGGPAGPMANRLRLIAATPPVCLLREAHPAHPAGTSALPSTAPAPADCLGMLPLVTLHDLHQYGYTRMPRPPKSSCYFCPFHRLGTWQDMRRDRPVLFALAADLEAQLIARRAGLGKDPVYLTRFGKPLALAAPGGQGVMFEMDDGSDDDRQCDNGWCGT